MIEIYLLEQLVAFAKHGKLLSAAEELHISQPALSRSMKKLEEEFGVPLFHRENSKISLNETGKIAAEYAEKVLNADRDMIDKVLFFDRQLRTISVGACTPFPVQELMPVLQDAFIGMAITSEIADDDVLLSGLKNRLYQLIVLHEKPKGKEFFCQRFLTESLYVTLAKEHPLAYKASISFADLSGTSILVSGNIGFWMDVCKEHFDPANLLVQSSIEAMGELVEASSLPFFNSDRMLEHGYGIHDRVSIPIDDDDAHATYYIACLSSEKKLFSSVFNAVREAVLRNK